MSRAPRVKGHYLFLPGIVLTVCNACLPIAGRAQSPEFLIREFASAQIKKGVRTIGMGGDGATSGNYALVWRDSSTALIDAGNSRYSNGNTFSFTAVGVTLPRFKNGFVLYAMALSQTAGNVSATLKTPGPGNAAGGYRGDGNNQAVFIKAAMPMGKGFSIGLLLSYEVSQFDLQNDLTSTDNIRYHSRWSPSGGIGLTWQPLKNLLLGCRAVFSNDREYRLDKGGTSAGMNHSQEYRAGIAVVPWPGALLDAGGNIRHRSNSLLNTHSTAIEPNLGIEQNIWKRHFAVRAGLDETSPTAGISLRFSPVVMDIAYVHNLALARLGTVFGDSGNSIIATFIIDFGRYIRK